MSDSIVALELDAARRSQAATRPTDLHGWRRAVRRFLRQRFAMAGLILAVLIVLAALLSPWIAPYGVGDATSQFMAAPSAHHLLGTDQAGYDLLSRVLYATRTSLGAALLATALSVGAGTLIGLISGYFGGWLDSLLMRCADAVLAFPGLLMAMAVVGALGPGVTHAMIGVAVAFTPGFARLVRGEVMAVREESYIEAAQVVGAGPSRIIRRHIVPNILSPVLVQAFMVMGFAVLAEGGLAFIGLSVQPPSTSLGSLIQRGFTMINVTLRLALVPGVVITLLSVSFNAIADGLRDALGKHEFSVEMVVQA